MPTFSASNFGCRLNQAETSLWIQRLQEAGWTFLPSWKGSDYLLINGCTLTQRADAEIRRFIRQVRKGSPRTRLVVAGCFVHTHRTFLSDEGVDLVFPNEAKDSLPETLISAPTAPLSTPTPTLARGFLKINDGCDYRCRYCIIPSVRGPARSLAEEAVEERLRQLLRLGHREIVVTGINILTYRREEGVDEGFLRLLERLLALSPSFYLRLTSLDPRAFSPRLAGFLVSEPRVAAHFHLSLQNGSPKILRAMGRPEEADRYSRILSLLAKKEDRLLAADYIVGFPGEGEEEFQEGLAFLEGSPLDYLHIFPYSPRPGTPAALLKRPHSASVKERVQRLRRFHEERFSLFCRREVGRVLKGVIIRAGEVLTENYMEVQVGKEISTEREGVFVEMTGVGRGKILSLLP